MPVRWWSTTNCCNASYDGIPGCLDQEMNMLVSESWDKTLRCVFFFNSVDF